MINDVLFYALSALAIWSGWRVFRVDSMVRATFLLLLSFIAVGGIALLMAADYIGVATVFMMAVEMMVMALFMVMFMMNPAGLNPMQMVHQYRLSVAAGVVIFVGLAGAVLATRLPDNPLSPDRPALRDLGIEMLGGSMLIFETAGITLLATMVGAVVLSSRRGRFGAADDGALPPGLEPGGAPAGRKVEPGGGHGGHGGHGSSTGPDAHEGHKAPDGSGKQTDPDKHDGQEAHAHHHGGS